MGGNSKDASDSSRSGPSANRKRGRDEFESSASRPLQGHASRASTSSAARPIQRPMGLMPTYQDYEDSFDPGSWTREPPPKKSRSSDDEKRPRRFRGKPPRSFLEIYGRAAIQRFYVLSRSRIEDSAFLGESFEVVGSTGNIYIVIIDQSPTCNCPHGQEGNQCKHIVFVLTRVLRTKPNLAYQLAFLLDEVRDIFWNAPLPAENSKEAAETDKKRKPIEGDCPICFETMETGEALVWCEAACGQNLHRDCFETWARTKRSSAGGVTCPYCRSKWKGKVNLASVKAHAEIGHEGYLNVARPLGISTTRDHSTYSRWWSGHERSYRRGNRWY